MNDEERAKAWCFDNNVTESMMILAWNKAIAQGNFVLSNLDRSGKTWKHLPNHLLKDLIGKYGEVNDE